VNSSASPADAPPDLVIQAHAKINLFLEVLGRRADGFHELDTVMQAVSLCDTLELRRREPGDFGISVTGLSVPGDESNLALRAARLLAERGGRKEGVHISLHKRIPIGGGLGGGSSDAAAVLRGLNSLWGLDADGDELQKLGAELGSDVNFFLHGGTALCRGRGELIEPLKAYKCVRYLLYIPQVPSLTRDVYTRLRMPLTVESRSSTSVRRALECGDGAELGRSLFNRLEEPAFELYPDLARARAGLAGGGALGALLSGSGSTLYAVVLPEEAARLKTVLEKKFGPGSILDVEPVGRWK
jgi:4-diphosphocytidyl-2-C-methyl-D-erythritol kinase